MIQLADISLNPNWQLIGWILLIVFFITLGFCLYKSTHYAEEEGVCPTSDTYTHYRDEKDIWPSALLGPYLEVDVL